MHQVHGLREKGDEGDMQNERKIDFVLLRQEHREASQNVMAIA